MKLQEYKAKQRFARSGLPATCGYDVTTPLEADQAPCTIDARTPLVKCKVSACVSGNVYVVNAVTS